MKTLGVDFAVKRTRNYILQIWDMAGQENYQKLREQYFKGTHGVIVVCDRTNNQSLESMNYWINEVDHNLEHKVPICIVGNKIDLRTAKEGYIDEDMAKTATLPIVEAYGANYLYVETSAKTGENVDLLFETMLGQIIEYNFTEFAEYTTEHSLL